MSVLTCRSWGGRGCFGSGSCPAPAVAVLALRFPAGVPFIFLSVFHFSSSFHFFNFFHCFIFSIFSFFSFFVFFPFFHCFVFWMFSFSRFLLFFFLLVIFSIFFTVSFFHFHFSSFFHFHVIERVGFLGRVRGVSGSRGEGTLSEALHLPWKRNVSRLAIGVDGLRLVEMLLDHLAGMGISNTGRKFLEALWGNVHISAALAGNTAMQICSLNCALRALN